MGITLTGGLDSRVMLGAVSAEKLPVFLASTMGIPGCDEITIAKKVANSLHVRYRPFYIKPQTVFEADNLRYFNDEDCDQLIQALWKPYTASLQDVDVLMHGLDLDVTFGGIYLTPELAAVQSREDLISYTVKNALSVSPVMFDMLFQKQVINKINYNPRELIMQFLKDCDDDDVLNAYDHFIMKYSMFRVILQRYRAIRNNVETISPMYDRALIDLYLTIPPQLRKNYNIFQKFIKKLSLKLSKIIYQRTALPPTAPIASWKESQKIDGQIEELYREIAHSTNGDVYVPFKKYYTNVDEWLRFNPHWMKATRVLLQSPASILRNEWLNAEYLDTLIAAHQKHVCSYMKIIHLLMSAEIYLRMDAGCTIEEVQKTIY
jgi:asparagine synthetase B (glutamine-hydrolysing)